MAEIILRHLGWRRRAEFWYSLLGLTDPNRQTGSPLPRLRNIGRVFAYLALSTVVGNSIPQSSAQDRGWGDFAELIKTPPGIQSALEHCDGHPDFEAEFANWLEAARPQSPAERKAVRETSLQLLGDTTNLQVALALIDGVLRRALEDAKRAEFPEGVAKSVYADIAKAVKNRPRKAQAIEALAYGLAEDGTVTDQSQARFAEQFLNLAEPRAQHHVEPAKTAPVAHALPSVSKQATPPREEPEPVRGAGTLSQLALFVGAIWLIVHLVMGRRTA